MFGQRAPLVVFVDCQLMRYVGALSYHVVWDAGRALSVASGSQSAGGSELADGVSVTSGDEAEITVDWR